MQHADGYDKLKPYGFPIHGCIDGFSRRLIWLKVSRTNNDPAVVAGFFFEAVQSAGGCPTILRTDNGTENTVMASVQSYLRSDSQDETCRYLSKQIICQENIICNIIFHEPNINPLRWLPIVF